MSPKSRGRPKGRGRQIQRQRKPVHEIRLSDRVMRDAHLIASRVDALEAERWISGWLGAAWAQAPLGAREPEKDLHREVVGRACGQPSATGVAAVAALRRLAPDDKRSMLDETISILLETQQAPPWFDTPAFEPVKAWRAVDVWDSERLVFVEYGCSDPRAGDHTLMAHVTEPGGTVVATLGVLNPEAAQTWRTLRPPAVPMPQVEVPIESALADIATAMRRTDMLWPRHDDVEYEQTRALAWARCREYLPDWDAPEELSDEERQRLTDDFLASADPPASNEAARSLVEIFLTYGEGYLNNRPFGWSPGWVEMFLVDWLPRKAFLDVRERAALGDTLREWVRFALGRRGVEPEWIAPVVAAVDEFLPEFHAAIDDDSSWGPAKQIAAELTARGVDLTDKAAVDRVISELNAQRLAQSLLPDPDR